MSTVARRSRRVDHQVDKLRAEPPHPQRNLDGYQSKDDLKVSHPADGRAEALDIFLVLGDQLSGEEIRPELSL